MKILKNKLSITIILSMFFTLALSVSAFAAGIYVNDATNKIDSNISQSYAIDGDGTVGSVSDVYAITSAGTEKISGAYIQSEAAVSGTVKLNSSTVKVALDYYYSTSRDSSATYATLKNTSSGGYYFGYYDSSRKFVSLGSTSETGLTIIKDTNTTLSAGTIGCYHIKLNTTYSSLSAAQTAAAKYTDGFPAYYNGTYYVLVGSYTTEATAKSAITSRSISGTAYTASSSCVVVTKTDSTKILFEFDCQNSKTLAIVPVSGVTTQTAYASSYSTTAINYYGGFEFKRINGGSLTAINVINLESYLTGVVSTEMSYSWPLEALKAQTVCARTYAANMIMRSAYYSSYGYDLTDDTYCQAYSGTSRIGTNGRIAQAVNETAGQCIVYNGSLISALYFSSDGGATESSVNVFGSSYGYLIGKIDPYEAASNSLNSKSSWTNTFTADSLGAKVGIGTCTSATATYSATGNVIKLVLVGSGGTKTLTKSECRSSLGLNSIRYTITKSGSSFIVAGGGWGHNVGMSQYGAYAMASTYGFSYKSIVGFYYTGIKLATATY